MKYQRTEYPRPQFRRDEWTALNGEWACCFEGGNAVPSREKFTQKINVPFTHEYEASGICDGKPHCSVWYRRTFKTDKRFIGKRVLLCFNGADYTADVWVNDRHAVTHTGGFAPFSVDITEYIADGENELTVHCADPLDPTVPRGKQSWLFRPFGCWYTPNTGLWQSVWLELFDTDCISEYTATPDIDTLSFGGEIATLYGIADAAEIKVCLNGKPFKTEKLSLDGKHTRYCVRLMESDFVDETLFWTPDKPTLFTVDITLYCGKKVADVAHTRIGMRSIAVENGIICLNHKPLYQRLVLDQGYWRESGLTPPSVEAIKKDIELAKAMGFNGARKHQKNEDPYFYYLADELGFLTWCEMPSAYNFTASEVSAVTAQWQDIVASVRNYASVICYVPLNESWGVRKILTDGAQQDFARALYYVTKAIDASRLVSANDGWENVNPTDIVSVHDYAFDSSAFATKYAPQNLDSVYPGTRKLMAQGNAYSGAPVLFTEFGGIALEYNSHGDNWGYNKSAKDGAEFLSRLQNLMEGVAACSFQGFCYTQLTDVQQEVNGLLDPDRKPKLNVAELYKIFSADF